MPAAKATRAPRTANASGRRAADGSGRPLCAITARPPMVALAPAVAQNVPRARAILESSTKWVNHTVLHYWFFGRGSRWAVPKAQADVVRRAFRVWKDLGIGLEFEEVDHGSEAEVRIGYDVTDGSWSNVGREILDTPTSERTTSFGWPLDEDDYGLTTALHEIGHLLGLDHEHQSPFAGITWSEPAVLKEFAGVPNHWDRESIRTNILDKVRPDRVTGTTWDPTSIMEYEFGPGLIVEPPKYRKGIFPPGTISKLDKKWVLHWYPADARAPKRLEAFVSMPLALKQHEQRDFLIQPDETRKYEIAVMGAGDSVLVLFETVDGKARYLSGDDDGGTDRHASITARLRKGRTYLARVRVNFPGPSGKAAIMYW